MKPDWIPQDMQEWLNTFSFRTPIQVRFGDTDMLGHINNTSYVAYFEYGRIAYLTETKVLDQIMYQNPEHAGHIVTANLEVHYLHEILFGEKVELAIKVSRIGRSSIEFTYALLLPEKEIIASVAKGAVVLVNSQTGKSQPLPEKVKEYIYKFETNNKQIHPTA